MLREEKKALRAKYKAMRNALDPAIKLEMDKKIADRVCSLVTFRYAGTILLYYPKHSEINTLPVMEAALRAGKRVAFPRTMDNGIMEFRYVDDPEHQLVPGRFGVPEPAEICELFEKGKSVGATMMLVPALAFDGEGYRLGYGKGYYDRYIDKTLCATSIGLVYTDFIAPRLPRGRYDCTVDLLVTEKGVKYIAKDERT